MKQLICDAFCQAMDIQKVPAGYAVRTPYKDSDGDPLLIYLVQRDRGLWRIEDDGAQVPMLEASGVDLGAGKARGEAFNSLLEEYGGHFDTDSRTIFSSQVRESEIGEQAVRFVGLLLRLQDLSLLHPHIVRSTFREDVIAAVHSYFDPVATVGESKPISEDLAGQEADLLIKAQGHHPVAIYLATAEERALEALVVKMEAEKYRRIEAAVVLLVERAKENPVKPTTYSLALSRLDAVLSFREAQQDMMERLGRIARVNVAVPTR